MASKLEKALGAAGLSVWLDDSDVTLGALLGKELQDSIRASHVLLLLWSEHAASSRWVASEWLTAFHLNRYIVPRGLDGTALPQCLQGSGSSHPDSRLPRAFHVLQLGRVHVLPEARDFPVSDLPYVADLRVEFLARLLEGPRVARLDDDGGTRIVEFPEWTVQPVPFRGEP